MEPRDRSGISGAYPSRRTFLAMLGSTGAARLVPQFRGLSRAQVQPVLFCIGTIGAGSADALHTAVVEGDRCERLDTIFSERPVALAVHPTRPIIYAANDVGRYRHEPRGTVEAFLVDQRSGRLEGLGRHPLSLSATHPRGLAVSPDGRTLLVASFGGGAYNVLPLDPSGLPGAPSSILKQVGRGSHLPEQRTAHPACILFDPLHARSIAADFGADRLDILCPEPDEPQRFTVVHRISSRNGTGPCSLALNRQGTLIVAQSLCPALTIFRRDGAGQFERSQETILESAPTAIALHPQHDFVYAALDQGGRSSRLCGYQPGSGPGTLQRAAEITLPAANVRAIHAEQAALYLASDRGLIVVTLEPSTGTPVTANLSVDVGGAASLAAVPRSD